MEQRRLMERERLAAQQRNGQLLLFPQTQVLEALRPSAFKARQLGTSDASMQVVRDTGRGAQEAEFRTSVSLDTPIWDASFELGRFVLLFSFARRLHDEFTKDAGSATALRQQFTSHLAYVIYWQPTGMLRHPCPGYMEQQGGRQQLLQQQLDVCRKPMERADCERFCMLRGCSSYDTKTRVQDKKNHPEQPYRSTK